MLKQNRDVSSLELHRECSQTGLRRVVNRAEAWVWRKHEYVRRESHVQEYLPQD